MPRASQGKPDEDPRAQALGDILDELERMTDDGFRRWTRILIFLVSSVYLARAAWLFWSG